jgi:ankyrin repeat protein
VNDDLNHGMAPLVVLTGAAVDSMDKNGCTALHIAALYGHELLSGTLLAFQADPSKSGYEGTLLHLLSCFYDCFVSLP